MIEAVDLYENDVNTSFDVDYLKSYGSDLKRIVTSPARWDGASWLKAGGVLAVTGGLMFAEKGIRRSVLRNRNTFTEDIAHFARNFGEIKLLIPGVFAGYLVGKFTKSKKVKRVSLLLLKSIVIAGGSLQLVTRLGHRNRPDETEDSQKWDGPNFSSRNLSFPSGHSAVSFSIATVLSSEFSDYKYLKPFFFTMCGLTALSRIHDNRHWASDVFMGSTLGFYMGSIIVENNSIKNKTGSTTSKKGLRGIAPIFSDGSIAGLSVAYSF